MTEFDKKIKDLSKNVDIPASYDEKLDETLRMVMEKGKSTGRKAGKSYKWVPRVAVCMVVVIAALLFVNVFDTKANIADFFRQTILDFLGSDVKENGKELGVGRDQVYVESKRDLMIALQETVIDSHSIYLLVKVTAPTDVTLTEDVSFDYFCFCKGQNYDSNQLVSGTISCELLEVHKEKPNVAIYVVSLVYGESLEEDSMVTAYFKDLEIDPNSANPEMLVEGMWSITFPLAYTVTENIAIEGGEDMEFPFLGTTAAVKEVELSPTVMTVVSDVTNFPYDDLGISDLRINFKLEMLDGSELVIQSRDPAEEGFIGSGNQSFDIIEDKWYLQDTIEFQEIIDINKIAGIYIEDLYIPVKQLE